MTNTTVIAWLTGIQPEVKPLTSGYRLALAFDLVQTTRAPPPKLRTEEKVLRRLRDILSSLKEHVLARACDTPRKILHVFDDQHPGYELGKSALTGRDYHITALLEGIACPLGFRIGLADWSCRVDYPELDYGSDWYGDCQETGLEEPETYVGVENLVDLDGNLILRHLDNDDFTEVVPANIEDDIRQDLEEGPTSKISESVCVINAEHAVL